jgi:electron transport complex protein RnfC
VSTNPGPFRFHGGLHLDDHKSESLTGEIVASSLPAQLVLRVSQHIGEPNKPLVKAGDRVSRYQPLATSNEAVSAPLHSPVDGSVVAIEPRPIAHPSGHDDLCIVIEPDAQQVTAESGGNSSSEPNDLLDIIRQAGIVGLGGAVFPTAAKLQTALEHGIRTLIINGAECEPYITCDHQLMNSEAPSIVRGIAILQQILQPEETLIGIEDNKASALPAMQQALDAAQLANTRIVTIPSVYPSGGEKQLIRILTGHEIASGSLAFADGFLTQNVGTCAALTDAVDLARPLVDRVVTVTGPGVRQPGNWRVPLGTPISHLVEQAGGYAVDQPRLIMGGPMMGLPLDSDAIPVVKATNCILVLDRKDQPKVAECVRCSQCAEVCPAQLLPQQLYWHSRARQFDLAEQYHLFDCIECGCCSAVCPSHLPLVQFYRYAKSEIWEQRRKAYKSDRSRRRHEFREARIARQKALDEERRRQKREALAKKKKAPKKVKSEVDPKAAAVQAALERVKARKQEQQVVPKNTDNLSAEQQRQIEAAEQRRNRERQDKP